VQVGFWEVAAIPPDQCHIRKSGAGSAPFQSCPKSSSASALQLSESKRSENRVSAAHKLVFVFLVGRCAHQRHAEFQGSIPGNFGYLSTSSPNSANARAVNQPGKRMFSKTCRMRSPFGPILAISTSCVRTSWRNDSTYCSGDVIFFFLVI
jgi:hypothetical protein